MIKYDYLHKLTNTIEECIKIQEETIDKIVDLVYETIKNDKIVHLFGTGHSHLVCIEPFARAGGLGNVNAMLDPDSISISGAQRGSEIERVSGISEIIFKNNTVESGDLMIVISNSGRNAMPVEMALTSKAFGLTTIGITSLTQSKKYDSRHSSGKKLYEICDYVLDNFAPSGDGIVDLSNGVNIGGVSSIVGMTLLNNIFVEASKKALENNIVPPIYTSQNVDGYNNDFLFKRFKGRVKYL